MPVDLWYLVSFPLNSDIYEPKFSVGTEIDHT